MNSNMKPSGRYQQETFSLMFSGNFVECHVPAKAALVKATRGARIQALFLTPKLQGFGLNSAIFASFPQVEPMAQDWPRSESMECCFP